MRVVAIREAKQQLSDCVDEAQRQRVLITRHGKPAAVVIGVEGRDLEQVLLMQDPRFWELIQARRAQPTLSIDQVRQRFGLTRRRGTSRRTRNSRPGR